MTSKNNTQNQNEILSISEEDLLALESNLSDQFTNQLADLEVLKQQHASISNPDKVGQVVIDTVWDQLMNNIAAVAGDDFITENGGMTLDLRKEAHIQTTANFEKGKIATHNKSIDYQARYDNSQKNFQKKDDGTIKTSNDRRTGKEKATVTTDARKKYDKDRTKGTGSTDMDHTIAAAEIMRDTAANAHVSEADLIKFANSEDNLHAMDSSANRSKSDSKMEDWLESERFGEKPSERFNIDEDELRKRDEVAREEYEKLKEKGKAESIKTGKESRKKEAFKITGKALRTAVIQLLAEFTKEMIRAFVKWMRSAGKKLETLMMYFKSAISKFVSDLAKHLLNSAKSVLTTIVSAINQNVTRIFTKIFSLFTQGIKSLKEVLVYLKEPENKTKPLPVLLAGIGKIAVVGLAGVGTVALSTAVESGLVGILPILGFEIPFLGSIASLLGVLISGIVSGVISAIIMNWLDKFVAKYMQQELVTKEIENKNSLINLQKKQLDIAATRTDLTKIDVMATIEDRHKYLNEAIGQSLSSLDKPTDETIIISDNERKLLEMQKNFDDLLL